MKQKYVVTPHRLNADAVASSAGKNNSIASSDNVISIGVPNIIVVLMNDRCPAAVLNTNGITIEGSPASS